MPLRALLTGGLSVESPAHLLSPGGSAHRIPFPGSTALFAGLSEQGFIDAYFLYYHTAYPFLHEATFRAQHANQHPRPQGNTWPILLNTVLALGAWSIGDENSTMDDAFYHEVNRISHDTSVFEIGNLALVQALLLLSNYTQKRNKPNTGWNYLGLAVRMALSLGLHREFPKWNISPFQREMRRRVWWGVYIFDSGASITFGRPVLLPESTLIDVNHVLNIHEEVQHPFSITALIQLTHLESNTLHHNPPDSTQHPNSLFLPRPAVLIPPHNQQNLPWPHLHPSILSTYLTLPPAPPRRMGVLSPSLLPTHKPRPLHPRILHLRPLPPLLARTKPPHHPLPPHRPPLGHRPLDLSPSTSIPVPIPTSKPPRPAHRHRRRIPLSRPLPPSRPRHHSQHLHLPNRQHALPPRLLVHALLPLPSGPHPHHLPADRAYVSGGFGLAG